MACRANNTLCGRNSDVAASFVAPSFLAKAMALRAMAPIVVPLVPVLAQRLHDVRPRRDASMQVHPPSHWIKVFRIDAIANTAKVIEIAALGDLADKQFVSKAMSHHLMAMPQHESAVAIAVKASSPKPTRISLLDLLPEALKRVPVWRHIALYHVGDFR
jgi:hypothetical protein